MRGFFTLDQAEQSSAALRRSSFFTKGFYKVADTAIAYDWTDSVFNQTSIAAYTQIHNGADNWSGGGGYARGPNTINYKNTIIPYVDTSSGTATLKLCSIGHAGDGADDFVEVDTGAQGAVDNNWLACVSTTGITFSGGNMVDGSAVVKWKFKHDAKSDTYHTCTAVLWAESNVLEAQAHWNSNTSSSIAYVTEAYAKANGNLAPWKATWDPDTNTWTVDTDDDLWQGSSNGAVGIAGSGGSLAKKTTQYDITGSSPSDNRIWEITVGTP